MNDSPQAAGNRSPYNLRLEGETAKRKLRSCFRQVVDAEYVMPLATSQGMESSEAQRFSAMYRQLRDLIKTAVLDGELPEKTAVNAMALLCSATLAGMMLAVQDEIDEAELQLASDLFVGSLGFHVAQPAVRRRRKP